MTSPRPDHALPTRYRVLPDVGDATDHSINWPREPHSDLINELCRPLIGGGFIERVAVLHDGAPMDMVVDEQGHMKGLPRNEQATAIYRAASLRRDPDLDPETLPWIAGPAVLFLRRVWF